jgi:pimeloyl-ACP methyl ester carboxylesterase
MKQWFRRVAMTLVALGVVALLAGTTWEWLARRFARRDSGPPGRLVGIGGRRIHIDCRGGGKPVVVLIAGLGVDGSTSWSAVHDSLAHTTRTCAVDRAGILSSDPAPGPATAQRGADDIHAALASAGEATPLVLVGHSLGGPYAMVYTKSYGADVAGLVLVDASHPDQIERLTAISPAFALKVSPVQRALVALAWSGLPRLLLGHDDPLPNQSRGALRTVVAWAPTSLAAELKETDGLAGILDEARTFRWLGDRPLVVLTAMRPLSADERAQIGLTVEQGERLRQAWKQLQDDEATWSSRSQHRLVDDASHYIQYWRPDVVVAAVRSVVESVRAGERAAGR